jgi:hypothetical protein
MRKWFAKLVTFLALLWFFQVVALAAAPKSDAMVIVADSRKFSGWKAWWANLYNESHFLFALITIIVIPATALLLGRLTGSLVARLGINLKSRELVEH